MTKPTPREIGNPKPGLFKIKLVRGGPWVGAAIIRSGDKWQAIVDGCVTAECVGIPPGENYEIVKLWTFGRDVTPEEYRTLTRPGRDVQPRQPINLTASPSIF